MDLNANNRCPHDGLITGELTDLDMIVPNLKNGWVFGFVGVCDRCHHPVQRNYVPETKDFLPGSGSDCEETRPR